MQANRKPSRLSRVHPNATCIRNDGPGICTVLFDDEHLSKFCAENKNLSAVVMRESPKAIHQKLRRWAGRGHWMSIHSHPEILDSDGVPGLDLVFADPSSSLCPGTGHWYEAVSQWIDLRSGQLRVVYDEMFWEPDFDREGTTHRMDSLESQDPYAENHRDASSYLVSCEPGFYRAHAITRYREGKGRIPATAADLVIYFAATEKPRTFPMSDAILPIHPESQDLAGLRRKANGLPPVKKIDFKPRVTNGAFHGKVLTDPYILQVMMSAEWQEKFGYTGGEVLVLDVGGQIIHAMSQDEKSPVHDPIYQSKVKKRAKAFDNAAVILRDNESLGFMILKQSKKNPLAFEPGGEERCVVSKLLDEDGQPQRVIESSPKRRAKKEKRPLIPQTIGKPGVVYSAIVPEIEKCFNWRQSCVVEVRGKSVELHLSVSPPSSTDKSGCAEAIMVRHGVKSNAQEYKRFKRFPGCGERALKWLAAKAKGGRFDPKLCKLELDFFGVKRPRVDKKKLKQASISVWKEVFGLE